MNVACKASVSLVMLFPNFFCIHTFAQESQQPQPFQQEAEQIDRAKGLFNAALDAYLSGDYVDGVKRFRQACFTHPHPPLKYYDSVAWNCATCPDKKARNAFIAISAAEHVCEETNYANPSYLDTYAAALAEMGDFDNAVKWQEKALELAPISTTSPKLALSLARLRLQLYKQHLPYRETPDQAIAAEYKRIVGAPISGASLRRLTDNEQTKLIEFLNTVPELSYIGANSEEIRQHYDVFLLMLVSESMGFEQRKDWTGRLADITSDQIERFRNTLIAEREEAAKKAQQSLARSDSQSTEDQSSGGPTFQASAANRSEDARSEQTVFRPEIKIEPKITLSTSPPKKAVDILIHSVTVYSTNAAGKAWDRSGPPDLKVCIRNLDNGDSFTTPTKRDTESADFNCKAIRVSEGQKIRVTVLDDDVFFDDMIGSYEKEITADTMKQGKVEWSFDRVSSLVLEFQP